MMGWRRIARSLLLFSVAGLFPLISHAAYLQAELPASNTDASLGTHVIVAGAGLEAGSQWLKAAHTQALIFKDRHRHGPILLISAAPSSSYASQVRQWGYANIQSFDRTMTGDAVVALLRQVPRIASLDFIGHNGAFLGFVMEDYDHRFFVRQLQQMISFRDHFTPDSFIRLMGCNTGWYMAPWMADQLNVPVAGTLTSADIQLMHSTDDWYFDENGQSPRGGFASRNLISYSEPIACGGRGGGGCLRLKTINFNYEGLHGRYKGTVPFEKFFCGSTLRDDCFRRMALSTQYLVGVKNLNEHPSLNDYAETLADQFCPAWVDSSKKRNCVNQVMQHLLGGAPLPPTFTTASTAPLTCNFKKCQFKQNCTSGTCLLESTGPSTSTTFVDELNAYKEGYGLWAN